jgi:hypothetical protein
MVVVDTIGAIAIGGAQTFTWLPVLFVFFFVPSARCSAEPGQRCRRKGGVRLGAAMLWSFRRRGGVAAALGRHPDAAWRYRA